MRSLIAAVALSTLALAAAAQTNGQPERFTATAMNLDTGRAQTVDLMVSRWSSDRDRDRLLARLMEKGPEKLLDTLQKMPKVGYIKTPESLAYDLHYARKAPLPDGGERVVMATDRPMRFCEVANQTRSVDYPFTVIELHVNADGEGEGTLSVATKITADKDNKLVVLENYGTTPVLLKNVKRERSSHE
jgi:hypothetical protein